MFVVDTNILLYAADKDAPDHGACRPRLEAWRRQTTPWHVTWGIVYEFLRVATHPNVFHKPFSLPQAWSFLDALFAAPSLSVLAATDRHRRVAGEVLAELPELRGNLVFDAHTAILMREHGIKTIYTHDADFNRFPFVEVVDPVHGHRRVSAPDPRSGRRR